MVHVCLNFYLLCTQCLSFFHTDVILKKIYTVYTVCRFLTTSSFIWQFEDNKYTTNQTFKLLSISKIIYMGKIGLISCC
jgi:hypothetical protein